MNMCKALFIMRAALYRGGDGNSLRKSIPMGDVAHSVLMHSRSFCCRCLRMLWPRRRGHDLKKLGSGSRRCAIVVDASLLRE